MNNQLLKQARECQFHQGALRELARSLPLEDATLDPLLAEAVAAKDELAFLHLALAALEAGRKVDARHLVAGVGLIPESTQLAAVALHAAGDVCQALVEAAAKGGMRPEREAFVLLLAGAWCVAHRNRAFPPALLARARTLARQTDTNFVADIQLYSLADLLQDAGLTATIASHHGLKGQAPARFLVDDLLKRDKASVFHEVPVEPGPVALSGYTVRRAVPRLGRNDPCHCGSGKKYKQCCLTQDQQRMLRSSAVPGLTVEELRDNQEPYLTRRRLLAMMPYELARLDPAKVDAELLPALIDRLLNFADYETAVSVFEKLGYRGELVAEWDASLYHTRHNARPDLVKRLARLRPDLKPEELNLDVRLLLMEETTNPALDLIEAEARQALREERPAALVDLAYDLLCSPYPALGILAARGVFRLTNYLEAATLFDVLSETRDRLNFFSKEPYQEIVERMFYEETGSTPDDNPALTETHARLEEKSKEVRELQTRLEALHQELQKREKPPVAPPVQPAQPTPLPATPAPAEDPALSELRRRVASLREALKERHNERNQLRRDLQTAMEDLETLREKKESEPADPATEAAEEEDQWLTAEEPAGIQPVRLPEFPKKFQESLAALPKPIVRSAMALVGRLAAGDPAAFKGCRRLQMTHEIWRQRVGLHHRLLFRFKADALEVVALINRRDLERKIKSLA